MIRLIYGFLDLFWRTGIGAIPKSSESWFKHWAMPFSLTKSINRFTINVTLILFQNNYLALAL